MRGAFPETPRGPSERTLDRSRALILLAANTGLEAAARAERDRAEIERRMWSTIEAVVALRRAAELPLRIMDVLENGLVGETERVRALLALDETCAAESLLLSPEKDRIVAELSDAEWTALLRPLQKYL